MGTNYYIKYKMSYDEAIKKFGLASRLFTSYELNNTITELSNGYVWKNCYYKDLDELNDNYYLTLHVGKSSYGWHFLLCIYPELDINNINDWEKFFHDDKVKIYDEYDKDISPESMIDIITNRGVYRDPDWSDDERNEFCRKNSAKLGLNGLVKHDHCYNNNTGGTYDYILEIDFS